MAASIHKVTLVGGSGNLGPHILSALLAEPSFSITVITRHNSTATFPPNTTILKVTDGYPFKEMASAFKGQDAVVVSLGFAAEHQNKALAEASIKAGVKRFISNHYGGTDTPKVESFFPIAARKAQMVQELKSVEIEGWSWTGVNCGLFFDFCIQNGFFGIDPKKKTARIVGTGDTTFSASNLGTIGRAVAKVLLHPEQTGNRFVYISSFETSLHQILEAEKKVVGADGWEVTYVDADQTIESATKDFKETGNFPALGKLALCSQVKEGVGADLRERGVLDNELLGLKEEETVEATVARVLKN